MDINNINSLVLAYVGDSVYELRIREHLIKSNQSKVDILQKKSIDYVSAKSQSKYLLKMMDEKIFTEEELTIIKRARNHKRNTHPKNTDIVTYKYSTGFEALIGYLYLKKEMTRIDEIMNYILGGRC